MRTNTDITIFNRYVQNRVVKYKKSYIHNVHWEDRKGANIMQSGLVSSDSSTVFIPFSSVPEYVKPKEFIEKVQGITLQVEDIIVKGLIEENLENEISIKTLESKYDDVRVITTVDTKDFGSEHMQHWEVGAK